MPSVHKRGNSFELVAYLGYDIKGRQIRRTKTWKPPLTQSGKVMSEDKVAKMAEAEAQKFEDLCLRGERSDKPIKLKELFEQWDSQHLSINLTAKTSSDYRKLWKRVESGIGHIRADKLTPSQLQQLYTQLQEPGMNLKSGGSLNCKHINSMLSSMFGFAVKLGIMPSNPCTRVTVPKARKKPPAVLTPEQLQTLLKALNEESTEFQVMISLLVVTGIRKGELHGLKWSDIDFDKSLLRIERAISYVVGQKLIEKLPKNDSSIRTVKLPAGICRSSRRTEPNRKNAKRRSA